MKVSVTNALKGCRVNTGNIKALASFFLGKASRRTGIEWGEISIILSDDTHMRKINAASLGHDYATDVISFNFEPMPGEPVNIKTGEIFVNVELARRLGPLYKKDANHELALYLAHGCDHLSGSEDNTQPRRIQMRRREFQWIKDAKRQDLNFRLIVPPK